MSYYELNTKHTYILHDSDAVVSRSPSRWSAVDLGWFSFATSIFILSVHNFGPRVLPQNSISASLALLCGGLAQVVAGMSEYVGGNSFTATAFTLFGSFWLSQSAILLPGIMTDYSDDPELAFSLGVYYVAWTIISVGFFIASLSNRMSSAAIFLIFSATLLVLGIGEFKGSIGARIFGGALGLLTSFTAYGSTFTVFFKGNTPPPVSYDSLLTAV